jgi:predicted O-methyltransferase YrrM
MKDLYSTHFSRSKSCASNCHDDSNRAHLLEFKHYANGMLPMLVYQALWQCAAHAPGLNFVEVGTAHGAATIALALGAKDAGLTARIHTIDRLGGKFSSRTRFGSMEQNRAIVQENFTRAGVAECISLWVGTTDDFIYSGHCPARIDLLLLDADGRIDRDLLHFYDLLAPEAIIVIDDIDPAVYLGTTHDGTPYVDLKHRITSLLLAAFESAGYLRIEKTVKHTAFCRRGDRKLEKQEFLQIALSCYRELVFADVGDWAELVQWHNRRNEVREALLLRAVVPREVLSIARFIRRLYRRVMRL